MNVRFFLMLSGYMIEAASRPKPAAIEGFLEVEVLGVDADSPGGVLPTMTWLVRAQQMTLALELPTDDPDAARKGLTAALNMSGSSGEIAETLARSAIERWSPQKRGDTIEALLRARKDSAQGQVGGMPKVLA